MFDFQLEPGRVPDSGKLNHPCGSPLISIITPYHNAARHIEQTWRCVVSQTFPWFEWIIVDDGSDADQLPILEQLAAGDSRITLLHQENGGPSAARNAAIAAARADLVVPLDADDLIVPTYLEVLYWLLYKHPDRDWAYTNTVGFQGQEYLWNKKFDAEELKTNNFLTNSGIIRKQALTAAGGYDESGKYLYEDWHLWLRLLANGSLPVKSSLYGFWYRRSEGGVLGTVQQDSQIQQAARARIQEAAKEVDGALTAIEYPQPPLTNRFPALSDSRWSLRREDLKGKESILLILPWMERGGADLFNLEVLKKIDRNRFHISVVTSVYAPNAWRQKFDACTDDIFELPSFLNMEDFPEFISWLIQTRDIRLTMVTNSYFGYYLTPWLRRKFPDMAILDYVHMEEWYWRRGGYGRLSGALHEITEHTLVCNRSTERAISTHFGTPASQISTLYIGVDQEIFSREAVSPGQCRKLLSIPENKAIILFPCRMDPQKRPFLMLNIARELKRRRIPAVIVAAGSGPLLAGLQETSRKMGLEDTVYFAGWQEDLRPFYRDAALTLNCSIQEGLALTAYESCAMGVPVVSSDAGGQRELIDDSNGKILPIYQEEAADFGSTEYSDREINQYADAIQSILSDPERCQAMCRRCREKVEADFSTDVMIRKLEQIFHHYIHDPEALKKRRAKAAALQEFPALTDELTILHYEIEGREAFYQHGLSQNDKNELIRIASSKWGRRLIKVFLKLRLNKLLR